MGKCAYCNDMGPCNRHRPCLTGCMCARHGVIRDPRIILVRDPSAPIDYRTKHGRVYRARGKARENECVLCGSQATHWSQIHGTDGMDPFEHYRPLCGRCHSAYDEIGKRVAPAVAESNRRRRGWKYPPPSEETRQKISAARRGRPLGDDHKEKLLKAAQRPKSPEHREKIRAAMTAYHERRRADAQSKSE